MVVAQIAEIWLQQYSILVGGVAAGLLVFGLERVRRAAERVSDAVMPGTTGSPEYVTYRKLQVYRNAVESALADGDMTQRERAVLATLGRDLAVRPQDAAAVEAEVRATARRLGR